MVLLTEGISYHHMNAMFDCACITGYKNRLRKASVKQMALAPNASLRPSLLAGPVKPTHVETRCVLWASVPFLGL